MAKRKRTKLQIALDDLSACPESIRWVNGKTPATAWKQCKRPDWLLWTIAHLAKTDDYYKRALASAISVCIDVLCDNDKIMRNPQDDYEVEREIKACAIKISTLLDQKGQGKTVRFRRTSLNRTVNSHCYACLVNWSLDVLLTVGEDILRNACSYSTPDDVSMVISIRPKKFWVEMCNEIRRVVERPTVQELQVAAKNWLDEL
jgi:hypothetical protein